MYNKTECISNDKEGYKMRKNILAKLFILCIGFIMIDSLLVIKDTFLHAEEQEIKTYTADASVVDEPQNHDAEIQENDDMIPLDMKRITLTVNEAQNHIIDDLIVKINGIDYPYTDYDFIDNVLSLTIAEGDAQMIELQSATYYFEPSFILIDANDTQGNYNVKAFAGKSPDALEGAAIFGADGMQKDQYDNDEIVTVSVATKHPLHQIYYQIEDQEWQMSDGDIFEIHALSKEAHQVNVAYYVQYYYPQEQEPDTDGFIEPINPSRLSISFKAAKENVDDTANDPNPPPNPDTSNDMKFQDKDGNMYSKAEVTLKIEEMEEADFDKYRRVIAYYDEFKDIPSYQITYYQAALYAQDHRVQPTEMYQLILPYPPTTSEDSQFVIYQFKDGNTDGAVLLDYQADFDGIHVKVDNVSAFVIGWKTHEITKNDDDKESDLNQKLDNSFHENETTISTTASVNTGDETQLFLWSTLLCASILSLGLIINMKLNKQAHDA